MAIALNAIASNVIHSRLSTSFPAPCPTYPSFCHPVRPVLRFLYMKIMSLNTWGGRVGEALLSFIRERSEDVDIFCLQEIFKEATPEFMKNLTAHDGVRGNLFSEIAKSLPNHEGLFCPCIEDAYGIAMFVKKDIEVLEVGEQMIYEGVDFLAEEHPDADHTRMMQVVHVKRGDEEQTIVNLHGHWVPGDKSDTPETIEQTKAILETLNKIEGKKVICADFNLHPETQSVKMMNEALRNLVVENGVTSTRSSLFHWPQKFTDYIFVSRDVEVKKFEVLSDLAVSDHVPLIVEVE